MYTKKNLKYILFFKYKCPLKILKMTNFQTQKNKAFDLFLLSCFPSIFYPKTQLFHQK